MGSHSQHPDPSTPKGKSVNDLAFCPLFTSETGKDVVVEIRDQGIGIDPLDFEHIFDAFHRGKRAGKKEDGFGLGLAGGKAIVEGHGGEVR